MASGSVSCSVFGIRNPTVSGSGGTYGLSTTDRADALISSATPTADVFTAGSLASTDVAPDTQLVSATNTVAVQFTAANPIPSDGKIAVVFPVGFGLSGVSSTGFSCPGLSGSLTASVTGQTVTAIRSGGTATSGSTNVVCSLANVVNPASTGTSGAYAIRTLNSIDVVIDEGAMVSGDVFMSSGALSSTDVQHASSIVSVYGNVSVSYASGLGLPRDGRLEVVFPAGFSVAAAYGAACPGMDGSFAVQSVGQTVTISRSGGVSAPAGSYSCTLSGITTPATAGAGGTYAIRLLTSAGQQIAAEMAVASDSFSAQVAVVGGGGGGGGGAYLPPIVVTGVPTVGYSKNLTNLASLGIPIHALLKLPDDGNPDTQEDTAVYYVGADGLRHAFPNSKVYGTWRCDFSGVQVVNSGLLASIPLGKNVTYRPGLRLVKFPSVPVVYAVSADGVLRPLASENVAIAIFGQAWSKSVDDVSEAFYSDYSFGNRIETALDYSPRAESLSVSEPSDSMSLLGYAKKPTAQAPFCSTAQVAEQPSLQFVVRPKVPSGHGFKRDLSVASAPSADVRYLQEVLIALGPTIYPEQRVTGNFGPATRLGVQNLQRALGLNVNGILDSETRKKLNALLSG